MSAEPAESLKQKSYTPRGQKGTLPAWYCENEKALTCLTNLLSFPEGMHPKAQGCRFGLPWLRQRGFQPRARSIGSAQ